MAEVVAAWRPTPLHIQQSLQRLGRCCAGRHRELTTPTRQICSIGGLGLLVLQHRRFPTFDRKQIQSRVRRASQTHDTAHDDPSGFNTDMANIESQIRSLDGLCSQAAGSSFPSKSNRRGLEALSDLESLANSVDRDSGSLLHEGGKDTAALAASMLEEQHDVPASSASVLLDFFDLLQGGEHKQLVVPDQVALDLDHQAGQKSALTFSSAGTTDPGQTAQGARIHIAAAMSEICSSQTALGSSEAAVLQGVATDVCASARVLEELLEECGYLDSNMLFGQNSTMISGVVDVATKVKKGDLLLLTCSSSGTTSHNSWEEDVGQAVMRGVSAVGIVASESNQFVDAAQHLLVRFADQGLQTVCVLASGQSTSLASDLANAFYSTDASIAKMQLIGIVGGADYEVRSAAWFLFKLLEKAKGAAKTGLLSDRRSIMAFGRRDVNHALTPCIAHELMVDMASAGVEICVVEIIPGCDSFGFADLDLVVDLGETANSPDMDPRQGALRTTRAVVGPGEGATEIPTRLATYTLEDLSAEVDQKPPSEIAMLTKAQIVERLADMKVDDIPKTALKSELVRMLLEHLPSEDPVDSTWQPVLPTSPSCLQARICPISHIPCLEVQLSGMDIQRNVKLSLVKQAGRAAVAALCAAGAVLKQQQPEASSELLADAVESICPPPGTFEIFADESMPGSVIILHEAASPGQVQQALQVIRCSMPQVQNPKLTAVFGCDGEVSRGDRARFGWALASCDGLVLTSASPRGEPPMQILEDILDAVKQRRAWLNADALAELDVFVVADRADAIKQAALLHQSQAKDGDPLKEVTVVFGSSFEDVQDAADVEGEIRTWLCNDRRLIQDALRLTKGLRSSSLDEKHVPWWGRRGRSSKFPGRSLHWSYAVEVEAGGGRIAERL